MSAPPKTPITRDELVRTNAAMLVLTSLFILLRVVLQIAKRRPFELPDFFIYLAFAIFISMWTCYILTVPPMFRVFDVLSGLTRPYATILDDAATMLRLITSAQMCFYTLLFCVKMSLLTLYRKLLTGLPTIYNNIWWGTVAFCAVVSIHSGASLALPLVLMRLQSWIGSVFTSVFTCDDLNEKFSKGKCGGTPNEQQRIIFSLYFAYSVDVATDLASTSRILNTTADNSANIVSHVPSFASHVEPTDA